jgi:hypothetical protein
MTSPHPTTKCTMTRTERATPEAVMSTASSQRRIVFCLGMAALAASVPDRVGAAPISWTNPATGDWFDAANWSLAVPAAADEAFVNNGGTAIASGLLTPTTGALRVGAGTGTVSGVVTITGLDLALGTISTPLRVGGATAAAATAVGALTVDGSVRGLVPGSSIGSFAIGTANGAGASGAGTVIVVGDLSASSGQVGSLGSGNGTAASGSLTVGGNLDGLFGVGIAIGAAGGAASTAIGAATIDTGNLTLGTSGLVVGLTQDGSAVATGTIDVLAGALRAGASPFAWQIGVATAGTASGAVHVQSIDTAAQSVAGIFIGSAANGGVASGELRSAAGNLAVSNNVAIGVTAADFGGTSVGTLALGGALQASGAGRRLDVGRLDSVSIFAPGTGAATGTLEAAGVAGFRAVDIGRGSAHFGTAISASGNATIGAGGIVNATDPGGTLRIGVAEGRFNNGTIVGPGPVASATVTVGGDIAGYDLVDIGRVQNTGTATGALDLRDGTLTTARLRIGTVDRDGGSGVISNGATDATGRLGVTDGAIVMTTADPLFAALTEIGRVSAIDATIPDSAKGELALVRSSFAGGILRLGAGGGRGGVSATDASSIEVADLIVGDIGGLGELVLDNSTLAVRAGLFPGNMSVGATGGSGSVVATASTITVDGGLSILRQATLGSSATASMAIEGGSLAVGGNLAIGDFAPGTSGSLLLKGTTASVGGNLLLGRSANVGTLFGEALLELDGSHLDVTGFVLMDIGAGTRFGIGGLGRGLAGYGALDARSATLQGSIVVDFTGLHDDVGFASADFDLIAVSAGFTGDFADVQLFNLPTGYAAVFGKVTSGGSDVWRVTLTQVEVPEPGALMLILFR